MLVRSPVTEEELFKGRNSIALALAMHSRAIVVTESIQDTRHVIHSESRLSTGEIKNLYPMKLAERIYLAQVNA
ncbi:hypothetical protein QUB24_21450 [Microcoleus sp. B9-D4]